MESTETRIKQMIINRYGSLKKFCEVIHMPWTTLDSILKRGIANSNITNVMKITKELKIDTESLASGILLDSNETYNTTLINSPPKILQYYDVLNDIGKHEATKRVAELTEIPRYVAADNFNYVNAAHAIDGATDEDKQFDEDIMDDENF